MSVEEAASQKRERDEALIGVPNEFLELIMSTVMTNSAILPSSRMNIDRQITARHLLNDSFKGK